MELLQEIANISGKPGLYRIVKPGRSGVIVESLDGLAKREMISVNARVSILKDISIYSEEFNKSTPLAEIFMIIREKHGEQIEFDLKNATNKECFDFFEQIMPDFDKEKVYVSDVKKVIQWYNILSSQLPEIFTPSVESPAE